MLARYLYDFLGIRSNIAKKPYIFVVFQGGGGEVRTPCPPSRSAHMSVNTRIYHITRLSDFVYEQEMELPCDRSTERYRTVIVLKVFTRAEPSRGLVEQTIKPNLKKPCFLVLRCGLLKPACSATETSYDIGHLDAESVVIIRSREQIMKALL